jgi:UDP:flavonoid glycosyltransferase YjiC (YdhE family)
VLDYFPYDAILKHADAFVSNSVYGGFTHAVINGVPSVFAGETEEKSEVAQRAGTAGFAINLSTQRPSVQELGRAVDEVLGSGGRYKKTAEELRFENEGMDAIGEIERVIVGMMGRVKC